MAGSPHGTDNRPLPPRRRTVVFPRYTQEVLWQY